MKVIVLLFFCVLALGKPQVPQQKLQPSKVAVLVKYESENDGSGAYKFAYETSDGQTRKEEGEIKNRGTENEILSVTGSFSFVGTDGVLYEVRYIADENGFQPVGEYLPKKIPPLKIFHNGLNIINRQPIAFLTRHVLDSLIG